MNRLLRVVTDPVKAIRTVTHLWTQFGVPPHNSIADYIRFYRLLDAGRGDFLFGRLWDRSIPIADRLSVLTYRDRARLHHRMNSKSHEYLIRDKARASEALEAVGVAGPPVVAQVVPNGEPETQFPVVKTEEELRHVLAEAPNTGVVCKPTSGYLGIDVHVFVEIGRDSVTEMNGTRWSIADLWQRLSNPSRIASEIGVATSWLIERRTPAHDRLTAIHGETLGCVRMVAFRFDDGQVGLLDPTWKIPVGNSGVDNQQFDSLFAPVNLSTGVVGVPIFEKTMLERQHHPDSGAMITGLTLPDWEEACDLSRRAMAAFPHARSLGFDLGLTNAGPRIVEANTAWGIWVMQSPHHRGVVRGEFLRFLEELGADDVIRREVRGL